MPQTAHDLHLSTDRRRGGSRRRRPSLDEIVTKISTGGRKTADRPKRKVSPTVDNHRAKYVERQSRIRWTRKKSEQDLRSCLTRRRASLQAMPQESLVKRNRSLTVSRERQRPKGFEFRAAGLRITARVWGRASPRHRARVRRPSGGRVQVRGETCSRNRRPRPCAESPSPSNTDRVR